MPISTIQGVGGNITMPTGFNGKHRSWTGNLNLTVVETTGFADNGYRTRSATYADISGNVESIAQFDAATTAPIPAALLAATLVPASAKGSITLTHTTGCTHAFTGVIGGINFTRPFDGVDGITYNYVSDGAITQTWDEA